MKPLPIIYNGKAIIYYMPENLSEVTVGQMAKLCNVEEKIADTESLLKYYTECAVRGEKDGVEYSVDDYEMDFTLESYNRLTYIRDIITIFNPDADHKVLSKISSDTLLDAWVNFPHGLDVIPTEMLSSFTFPTGTKPDFEDLNKEYSEFIDALNAVNNPSTDDIIKKKKYEFRLSELEKGEFVIIPIREVIMESYINLGHIRKDYPMIPEDIEKILEEKKITLEEFLIYLDFQKDDTPEKIKDKFLQQKVISKYLFEYKSKKYENAAAIIAHISIPKYEEYSYEAAEKRIPYLKELPMTVVEGLVDFFLSIQQSSRSIMAEYLTQ